MAKAKEMIAMWMALVLGVGPAWGQRDVEMQIEWGNSEGRITILGGPSDLIAFGLPDNGREDFEAGWGDWHTDNGVWGIGKPTSGPTAAHAGQAVAATNLSGNYPSDTDSHLISPVFVLPTVSEGERLQLRFWQWYSYSGHDFGCVQVSNWDGSKWNNWTTVFTPTAEWTNSNWAPIAVDLTAYAGQTVRIAFYHTAASGYDNLGWYIDDLEIWKGVPTFVNPETFEAGWGDWHTDNGVWGIGKPTSGPTAAHAGQAVAATNLSGNYPSDTDSHLISPPLVLPTGSMLQLRFWQWYSYSGHDFGCVQVSNWDGSKWNNWTTVFTPTAEWTNSDWAPVAVDLTAYAGQTVRIAFYHTAASGYDNLGWYIDDVEIRGLVQPVVMSTWSLSDDTGISSKDGLTNDTTPTLTFAFSKPVRGTSSDIQITGPDGTVVTPDLVSGWDTDKVTVTFAMPLAKNGQYAVTLKKTIKDTQGAALNNGVDQTVRFTLDTKAPVVTADALTTGDTTPKLTGTVDDPNAAVEVTVDGWDFRNYAAVNNRNGTWTLPDDAISPALTPGIHQLVVSATDRAGNVGLDIGIDALDITGLRIAYRQMQYDAQKGQSSIDLLVTNNSSAPLKGTLWLVVKAISESSVTLANADGKTTDGDSYVNLTPLLDDGRLDPDETVDVKLTFNNPQQKRFTATVAVRTMP